jgi:hypothetical protein
MTVNMKKSEYKSAGGIITSPGKFQGEPVYAPYLYNQGADQEYLGADETLYHAYKISREDREHYPALGGVFAVVLYERDDGFVVSSAFKTAYDLGVFIAECEATAETEE